jgi:hypothetical protein
LLAGERFGPVKRIGVPTFWNGTSIGAPGYVYRYRFRVLAPVIERLAAVQKGRHLLFMHGKMLLPVGSFQLGSDGEVPFGARPCDIVSSGEF